MNKTQKWKCLMYSSFSYTVLGLLWVGIEKVLYGEIQHRVVDDIISIPMLIVIYMMWKFKTERDNLRNELKYINKI